LQGMACLLFEWWKATRLLGSFFHRLVCSGWTSRVTNDVRREPKNRIPNHPQCRPLDVVVDLTTPTNAATILVGIDVTIPHISSNLAKKSYPSIPSITRTHLASIREKLQGRTSNSWQGDKVISALNDEHIALIPFTVDHLGVSDTLRSTSFSTPATHPSLHHPIHQSRPIILPAHLPSSLTVLPEALPFT
jgi:hypothetical protein